jgi:hypothetical protein
MLGVGLDGFDYEIQPVGAVDFAKDAVGLIGQDALGFGEVIQAVEAVGIEVFHDEHRALATFRAGEQRQVISAEVKHEKSSQAEKGSGVGRRRKSERACLSPPPQRR